jgi:hypothetical protein
MTAAAIATMATVEAAMRARGHFSLAGCRDSRYFKEPEGLGKLGARAGRPLLGKGRSPERPLPGKAAPRKGRSALARRAGPGLQKVDADQVRGLALWRCPGAALAV